MLMNGRFGAFGGAYVPEILMPALEELEAAFLWAQEDEGFKAELHALLTKYAGRPTPLTRCARLGAGTKARIYLKREDLLHGGAHKTTRCRPGCCSPADGQAPIIAETGAGSTASPPRSPAPSRDRDPHLHGRPATSTAAAQRLPMELMGAE